jgi:hypothetical protein
VPFQPVDGLGGGRAALLGHISLETTRGYMNYRELHQMGENQQVA